MSDKERLVFAFIQFLKQEIATSGLQGDAAESAEVAIQCLETAFGLNSGDPAVATRLAVPQTLLQMFTSLTESSQIDMPTKVSTQAEKDEADRLKCVGNDLMKAENFQEALANYCTAIQLDPQNSVYYCNRAAAHSKMNNHQLAVDDCQKAITLDAGYSKAYGRMGLAYTALNKHREARDCYKKATELDPENASYRNNLQVSEQKLQEQILAGAGINQAAGSNPFGTMGGFDLGNILSNPQMMNMAMQMMNSPHMQSMMQNMMNQAGGSGGGAGGGGGGGGGSPNMENLLRAGQTLANQMQESNPDLVENLRQQFQGGVNGSDAQPKPPGSDQPPDDKKDPQDRQPPPGSV